ncbi:hypothetical protein FRB97_006077 [Tulasnella sp. 331]|nr:hypothetical protein FRB97_006077 [Tulasnella sp. 331]
MIHGIGFDSSYWNFGGPEILENYSYVEWAVAAGYDTFRHDRLGTWLSEHPKDTYNDVIIDLISIGDIGGYNGSKIIGTSHSYGTPNAECSS